MSAIKTPSNDIFGDIVARDIEQRLKVIDSNTDHLDRLTLIVS